jgi:flavin-dependent dehydrogenase
VEAPVSAEILRRFADAPLFIIGEVRLGYAWIFPKSDHLSIGIGGLHPRPGELLATLNRVIARYGISLTAAPWHGHPIPIYTGREPLATSRALLVGDAAGLADPLTGEGIRLAIKSGRLAAEAILAGRPDQYPHLIYRHIGLSHTFAIPLSLVFYRLMGLGVALGVLNRLAVAAFLDLIADRAEYPGVILRLVGSLPACLLARVQRQPPGHYDLPVLTGTQEKRR